MFPFFESTDNHLVIHVQHRVEFVKTHENIETKEIFYLDAHNSFRLSKTRVIIISSCKGLIQYGLILKLSYI